ncbi:MAG: enoyl-[acyl-carrier-protein] reductase FabI [Spirochaetae bacterium HGW-Spirochaetae-6]|nr:MAG: enoyl-[acyl-carrier-protein] reductase FabI [Spirochaetae bacterium HGW-Spirochaetae-6]
MYKKNALVIGIANKSSISAAIAGELYEHGYRIIPTYLNEKSLKHVKEVTDAYEVDRLFPYQVGNNEELEALIGYLKSEDQKIDVFVHGIAFASEIKKNLHEVSWSSFKEATYVSAFSMVEITQKLLKSDVLNPDASILTISYRGSQVAVEGYNMMGPVKNILESLVRGLASELGDKGIRVNAVSPGPVLTRAASGIKGFDELIEAARKTSPIGRTATLEDIGKMSFELIVNPSINGSVYLVDCGESIAFTLR